MSFLEEENKFSGQRIVTPNQIPYVSGLIFETMIVKDKTQVSMGYGFLFFEIKTWRYDYRTQSNFYLPTYNV